MQGLWRDDSREIKYSSTVQLDMSTVVPSLAGPKRPQDRIALTDMKQQWHIDLEGQLRPDGGGSGEAIGVHYDGATFDLSDGEMSS